MEQQPAWIQKLKEIDNKGPLFSGPIVIILVLVSLIAGYAISKGIDTFIGITQCQGSHGYYLGPGQCVAASSIPICYDPILDVVKDLNLTNKPTPLYR